MYQSKEDLIKQYQFAEDEHQKGELYLEVLIDIRDVLAHMNSEINNLAYTVRENL